MSSLKLMIAAALFASTVIRTLIGARSAEECRLARLRQAQERWAAIVRIAPAPEIPGPRPAVGGTEGRIMTGTPCRRQAYASYHRSLTLCRRIAAQVHTLIGAKGPIEIELACSDLERLCRVYGETVAESN
jgi:hypothetical protein